MGCRACSAHAGRVVTVTTPRTRRGRCGGRARRDDERRGAAFVSACALVTGPAESDSLVVRGEWAGSIVRAPRGAGGFGYDPVFLPAGSAVTAAEGSPADKDAVSHRGLALAALVPALRALVR